MERYVLRHVRRTCSHPLLLRVAVLLCLGLIVRWKFPRESTPSSTRGLHILLPTTESNADVCKLMLSGAAAGFPEPILVGYGFKTDPEHSNRHLFKIDVVLKYLTALPESQSNDLVLILDAWDTWLQTPPQVMIEQYYKAIDKQNAALKQQGILGATSQGSERITNTILLGADKLCWPFNTTQFAKHCSSVPDTPLPDDVYGPGTDLRRMSMRPRYLNSGTVLGPVNHVRDVFDAVGKILSDENQVSDQFYFQILFNRQEKARAALARGDRSTMPEPNILHRSEFHMALDHESDVYQVHNWNSPYITWMSFNHTARSPGRGSKAGAGRMDHMQLPENLAALDGPFSNGIAQDGLPLHWTWADVMLGTNVVLQQVFPIYHMTGVKSIRSFWWARMWFHPYGEAVLKATRRSRLVEMAQSSLSEAVVAKFRAAKYVTRQFNGATVEGVRRSRDPSNQHGGAWTDAGEYLTWRDICSSQQHIVFNDASYR